MSRTVSAVHGTADAANQDAIVSTTPAEETTCGIDATSTRVVIVSPRIVQSAMQHPEDIVASRYLERLGNAFVRRSNIHTSTRKRVVGLAGAASSPIFPQGASDTPPTTVTAAATVVAAPTVLADTSRTITSASARLGEGAVATRRWKTNLPSAAGQSKDAVTVLPVSAVGQTATAVPSVRSPLAPVRETPAKSKEDVQLSLSVKQSSVSAVPPVSSMALKAAPGVAPLPFSPTSASAFPLSVAYPEGAAMPTEPTHRVPQMAPDAETTRPRRGGYKEAAMKANMAMSDAASLMASEAPPFRPVRSDAERNAALIEEEHGKLQLLLGRRANLEKDIEDMLELAETTVRDQEHLEGMARVSRSGTVPSSLSDAELSWKTTRALSIGRRRSDEMPVEPRLVRMNMRQFLYQLLGNGDTRRGTTFEPVQLNKVVQLLERQLAAVETALAETLTDDPVEPTDETTGGDAKPAAEAADAETRFRRISEIALDTGDKKMGPIARLHQRKLVFLKRQGGIDGIISSREQMQWLLESVEDELISDAQARAEEVAAAETNTPPPTDSPDPIPVCGSEEDATPTNMTGILLQNNGEAGRSPASQNQMATVLAVTGQEDEPNRAAASTMQSSYPASITQPTMLPFSLEDSAQEVLARTAPRRVGPRGRSAGGQHAAAHGLNLLGFMTELMSRYDLDMTGVFDRRKQRPMTAPTKNSLHPTHSRQKRGTGKEDDAEEGEEGETNATDGLGAGLELGPDGQPLQCGLLGSAPRDGRSRSAMEHMLRGVDAERQEGTEGEGEQEPLSPFSAEPLSGSDGARRTLLGAHLRSLRDGLLKDLHDFYDLHDFVHLILARRQELNGGVPAKDDAAYSAELEAKLAEHRMKQEAAQLAAIAQARKKKEEGDLELTSGSWDKVNLKEPPRRKPPRVARPPEVLPSPATGTSSESLPQDDIDKSVGDVCGESKSVAETNESHSHDATQPSKASEESRTPSSAESDPGEASCPSVPMVEQTLSRTRIDNGGFVFIWVGLKQQQTDGTARTGDEKRPVNAKSGSGGGSARFLRYELRVERPNETVANADLSTPYPATMVAIVKVTTRRLMNLRLSADPSVELLSKKQTTQIRAPVQVGESPICLLTLTPEKVHKSSSYGRAFQFNVALELEAPPPGEEGEDDDVEEDSQASMEFVIPARGAAGSRSASLDSAALEMQDDSDTDVCKGEGEVAEGQARNSTAPGDAALSGKAGKKEKKASVAGDTGTPSKGRPSLTARSKRTSRVKSARGAAGSASTTAPSAELGEKRRRRSSTVKTRSGVAPSPTGSAAPAATKAGAAGSPADVGRSGTATSTEGVQGELQASAEPLGDIKSSDGVVPGSRVSSGDPLSPAVSPPSSFGGPHDPLLTSPQFSVPSLMPLSPDDPAVATRPPTAGAAGASKRNPSSSLPVTPPMQAAPRPVEEWGQPHPYPEMESVEKNAVVMTLIASTNDDGAREGQGTGADGAYRGGEGGSGQRRGTASFDGAQSPAATLLGTLPDLSCGAVGGFAAGAGGSSGVSSTTQQPVRGGARGSSVEDAVDVMAGEILRQVVAAEDTENDDGDAHRGSEGEFKSAVEGDGSGIDVGHSAIESRATCLLPDGAGESLQWQDESGKTSGPPGTGTAGLQAGDIAVTADAPNRASEGGTVASPLSSQMPRPPTGGKGGGDNKHGNGSSRRHSSANYASPTRANAPLRRSVADAQPPPVVGGSVPAPSITIASAQSRPFRADEVKNFSDGVIRFDDETGADTSTPIDPTSPGHAAQRYASASSLVRGGPRSGRHPSLPEVLGRTGVVESSGSASYSRPAEVGLRSVEKQRSTGGSRHQSGTSQHQNNSRAGRGSNREGSHKGSGADSLGGQSHALPAPPRVVVAGVAGSKGKSEVFIPGEAVSAALGPTFGSHLTSGVRSAQRTGRTTGNSSGSYSGMMRSGHGGASSASAGRSVSAVSPASACPAGEFSVLPTGGLAAAVAADAATVAHVQSFLQSMMQPGGPNRSQPGGSGSRFSNGNWSLSHADGRGGAGASVSGSTRVAPTETDELENEARELYRLDPVRYDAVVTELMQQTSRDLQHDLDGHRVRGDRAAAPPHSGGSSSQRGDPLSSQQAQISQGLFAAAGGEMGQHSSAGGGGEDHYSSATPGDAYGHSAMLSAGGSFHPASTPGSSLLPGSAVTGGAMPSTSGHSGSGAPTSAAGGYPLPSSGPGGEQHGTSDYLEQASGSDGGPYGVHGLRQSGAVSGVAHPPASRGVNASHPDILADCSVREDALHPTKPPQVSPYAPSGTRGSLNLSAEDAAGSSKVSLMHSAAHELSSFSSPRPYLAAHHSSPERGSLAKGSDSAHPSALSALPTDTGEVHSSASSLSARPKESLSGGFLPRVVVNDADTSAPAGIVLAHSAGSHHTLQNPDSTSLSSPIPQYGHRSTNSQRVSHKMATVNLSSKTSGVSLPRSQPAEGLEVTHEGPGRQPSILLQVLSGAPLPNRSNLNTAAPMTGLSANLMDGAHHRSQEDTVAEVERILYEQMKAKLLLRAVIDKMQTYWREKAATAEKHKREQRIERARRVIDRALAATWAIEQHRVINLQKLIYLLDRKVGRVHGWLPHYSDTGVLMTSPPPRIVRGALTSTRVAASSRSFVPLSTWYGQRDATGYSVHHDEAGVICPTYLHYLPQRRIYHYVRLAKERRLMPMHLVRTDIQQAHSRHLLLGYEAQPLSMTLDARVEMTLARHAWPSRQLPHLARTRSNTRPPFTQGRFADMPAHSSGERVSHPLQGNAVLPSVLKKRYPGL